jgi:hypothetical protein
MANIPATSLTVTADGADRGRQLFKRTLYGNWPRFWLRLVAAGHCAGRDVSIGRFGVPKV